MRGLLECSSCLFWVHIPVDLLKPFMDIWVIVSNHLQITSEQGVVSNIKSDDCRIESNVGFGQMLSEDEGAFTLSKYLFHPIETVK